MVLPDFSNSKIVCLSRQFFLWVIRHIEGKRPGRYCCNGLILLFQHQIITICMASILLRADIIFMLFLYRCIIQSMAAGTAFIPITFVRSQSIKFQIFIFSPQKQADAKSRKLRKFPILFDVHFDRYFSCPVNLPYGLYIQTFWIATAATDTVL